MKKLSNKDSEDSSGPSYGLPVQVALVVFHCVPHLFAALSFNICRNGCGFWNCRTANTQNCGITFASRSSVKVAIRVFFKAKKCSKVKSILIIVHNKELN